jgi:hypothetical protein
MFISPWYFVVENLVISKLGIFYIEPLIRCFWNLSPERSINGIDPWFYQKKWLIQHCVKNRGNVLCMAELTKLKNMAKLVHKWVLGSIILLRFYCCWIALVCTIRRIINVIRNGDERGSWLNESFLSIRSTELNWYMASKNATATL